MALLFIMMSRVFEPKPCGRYSCLLRISHEGSHSSLSSVAFPVGLAFSWIARRQPIMMVVIEALTQFINLMPECKQFIGIDCEKPAPGF